jgi:hypothetical protein
MAFQFSRGQHNTYFIGSKAIMQFNYPNVIPIRTSRREHFVCQATCHPITNRVHSATSSERIREVRCLANHNHLDRLIFELMSPYKGLVRNDTTRSTVLYNRATAIGASVNLISQK